MLKLIILKVFSPTWVFAKVVKDIDGLEGISCDVAVGYLETTKEFEKGTVIDLTDDVKVTEQKVTKTFDDKEYEMSRLRFSTVE